MATRAGARNAATAGEFERLIPAVGRAKEETKIYKAKEDKLVAELKGIMIDGNLTKGAYDGYKASLVCITSDSLNEERAIEILKQELASDPELLSKLVKTREYLDQDALEAAMYQHQLPEGILATAIDQGKPSYRLTVSKEKSKF